MSVSQDASGQGQSIRSQKRKRSIDTSKCKAKPGIIEEPNRGSNVRLTRESKKSSDSGDESLVGSDSASKAKIRKAPPSADLTIDLFPRCSPVLGDVDPDPPSDGAHLLATVTQKCLKLL